MPVILMLAALAGSQPVRAAVAGSEVIRMDIRLMGADLIDELVYEWKKRPPSTEQLPLVVGEIVAPVGLDDRFQVEMENRLSEVLRLNPDLPVTLVHCSACTRMIAKSTPQGTILARGIDQTDVLADLEKQMPGRSALSLHFEASGRELQLRARIFKLQPPQKISWARTLSTSMSARRALQDPGHLIGIDEARKEQDDIIAGRSTMLFTTRPVLRIFNSADSAVQVAPLPFFEQSVENQLLPDKTVTSALTLGFSSLKDSLSAWTVGGHVAKLLGEHSLVSPDFFMFLGVHYIRMRGPTAAVFSADGDNLYLRAIKPNAEPKASLVAFRLGLEVHVKYRLGMTAFLENIPLLKESETVATKSAFGIPYHALGWGVVWRW
jgi:hypothetical protein